MSDVLNNKNILRVANKLRLRSSMLDETYDQPCDLRLLTPATCLQELSEPVITSDAPAQTLQIIPTQSTSSNRKIVISSGEIRSSPRKNQFGRQSKHSQRYTADQKDVLTDNDDNDNNDDDDNEPSNINADNVRVTTKLNLRSSASHNNIFMCKQCGNSYARPHSLNRHIRFECGVEPQFECPICHKKSKHKHNLVLHMRTHQHR